jgi:hypothetical protein
MNELTLERLKTLPPTQMFADGIIVDSPDGLNMTNSGNMLRWVAKTGAIGDWCIYCHWAVYDVNYIMSNGDKVLDRFNIRRLVPCTDEALAMYRY